MNIHAVDLVRNDTDANYGLDPERNERLIRKLRNLPPEQLANILKGNTK